MIGEKSRIALAYLPKTWYNRENDRKREVYGLKLTGKRMALSGAGRIAAVIGITLAVLGLVALTVALLQNIGPDRAMSPEEAVESPDPDLQPYPGVGGEGTAPSDAEGGASFVCESQLTADRKSGRVGLMFANPAHSGQNAVIILRVQGQILAQSRRIDAGYRITSLPLLNPKSLEVGLYQGEVSVYFFDTVTGERLVDMSCPITLTVK